MLLFLIAFVIYFLYRSVETMHMLQQNLYNENNRYIKWMLKHPKRVFCICDILVIILLSFLYAYGFDDTYVYIACMGLYIYGIVIEYNKNKKNQNKLPLKGTSRIKRLFFSSLIPIIVIFVLIYKFSKNYDTNNTILMLIVLSSMQLLIYLYYEIMNIINYPINRLEHRYYYNKAVNKLNSYNNLSVIGITGSYGKTTSKNILNEILNSKYISRATPLSYNSPYGLMLTINNYMDKFDQILVAEMGAYVRGEIKTMCDFVKPKYGILTTIGECHLESFKSIDNIIKAKFELIESLPEDGVAVLNKDDPRQVNYELKNKVKVIWYGIENHDADIYADNIKYTSSGSTFDIHYDGKTYSMRTRLLGSANIYNIVSSIALALYLNVDIDDIKNSVLSLKNTEHRLQLKKMGDVYQIDDAYNSNPVGARSALDVLDLMNGTKVCVTPGMVELGQKEYEENYKFGEYIAKVCDYVILVGEKKTKPIYDGLMNSKFDKDNIFIINKVAESYPLLNALKEDKKDLYALYENDLPDIYSEGGK